MCAKNWTDAEIEKLMSQDPTGAELAERQDVMEQLDEFLEMLNTPFFVEYRKKWQKQKEEELKPYLKEARKALTYEESNTASFDKLLRLYFVVGNDTRKLDYWISKGDITAATLKKALDAKKADEKKERAAAAREAQKSALDELRAKSDLSFLPAVHYNKKDPTIAFATDVFAKQNFEFETDPETGEIIEKDGRIYAKAFVDKEHKAFWIISTTQKYRKLDLRGYDFFLAGVLDQLYSEGNTEISLSQILKRLHVTVNKGNKQSLLDHLKLGASVNVDIDNSQIVKKWGKDPDGIRIAGQVFFIQIDERIRIIDGNISDVTVRIGGYSPFYRHGITFLSQAQEWDERLLKLYTGTRNESYWRILRYLLQEVGYMMRGGRNNRLLMSSLYDYVGIPANDRNKRKRIRETTQQILKECFAACGYITLNAKDKSGAPTLEIDESTGDIFIKLAKTKAPEKRIETKNQ